MRSAFYVAVTFLAIMGLMRLRHYSASRRQRVLQVFLDRPAQRLYGLDVNKLAGLSPGSIYPELARLETERWIFSDWGEEIPGKTYQGQPLRRRVYWLNPWRSDHEQVRT